LTAAEILAKKAGLAYFCLLLFTFLIYARPSDIIWSLQHYPLAQYAAVAALGAYILARFQGGLPFVWLAEVKLVCALTVLFMLGIPFAFWKGGAFDTFKTDWLKTFVIFMLLSQVVTSLERVRKLIWVILLSEFLVSAFTLFSGSEKVIVAGGRVMGANQGMLSGNYLGISVATTLPFIAVLIVSSRNFLKSTFLISTFGLVMLMVVKTASRSSLLMIVGSLLLVWVFILRRSAKARLLGLVLLGAVIMAVMLAPETFWERIVTLWDPESYAASSTAASAIESEYQRRALLQRSIRWTLENPIFGLGLGNFPIYSGTVSGSAQEWKGTHNTFTQVSSEAGIPAFLIFISLLWLVIRNMHRVAAECGDDPRRAELKMFAHATRISILAFIFACWFAHLAYDYHLYYLAGLGVALQCELHRVRAASLAQQEVKLEVPPGTRARAANGNGRERLVGGVKGRAW
jgi:hypothetical protein